MKHERLVKSGRGMEKTIEVWGSKRWARQMKNKTDRGKKIDEDMKKKNTVKLKQIRNQRRREE